MKKIISIIGIIGLMLVSFFGGIYLNDKQTADDMKHAITVCEEEQNKVARLYMSGDIVKAECFGEKPALEIHLG